MDTLSYYEVFHPLGYLEWIGLSIPIHENRGRIPLATRIFFRILGYIRQLWPLLRHLQLTLPQIRPAVSSDLLGTAPSHQCKKGLELARIPVELA